LRIRTVPSSWLAVDEYRLDARPYFSGAIEAKLILDKLDTVPLVDVTEGGRSGIFNGPRFARVYVNDPNHGTPLVSGADMLQFDMSRCSLIANKQVASMPEMVLKAGTTMISSYGTVGRCVYTRSDMVSMVGSDNVLKVIPDESKIPSGYLFAFLSCKFGIPFVTKGESGGVVTYLDPSRVYQLAVPRLTDIENQVHEMITTASQMRSEANAVYETVSQRINRQFDFPIKLASSHRNFSCALASSDAILKRLEATYHDTVAQASDELVASVAQKDLLNSLGITFGESGRIKQAFVGEEYGVPFLTSSEIFRLRYEPDRFLAKRLLPDEDEWQVREGDLLLARSGQVGGIIGRGVWADRRFNGACVSVDVIRISAQESEILPGYLYGYLFLTDVGYRQLVRTAAGTSIPHLSVPDVANLLIPRADEDFERSIDEMIKQAGDLRAEAQVKEDEARDLVEKSIEEAAQ